MAAQSNERIEFVYYPDGDRDPASRQTRVDLVREGIEWRKVGASKPLSDKELQGIASNVKKGRGEIQKIISDSRRESGEADLFDAAQIEPYERAA
jgi:hypothetical protein